MHAFKLICITLLSLVIYYNNIVQAIYYSVETEQCTELKSGQEYFFDTFLIPCASYRESNVEQKCLSKEEEILSMKLIPDWKLNHNTTAGNYITRSFSFNDFKTAFYFMSTSAQLAQKNDHHPNWSNLYNVVDVILTTDDKLCLGTFDIKLAEGMDYLYNNILNV